MHNPLRSERDVFRAVVIIAIALGAEEIALTLLTETGDRHPLLALEIGVGIGVLWRGARAPSRQAEVSHRDDPVYRVLVLANETVGGRSRAAAPRELRRRHRGAHSREAVRAKGKYIKSITMASTMGPGVKVDPTRLRDILEASPPRRSQDSRHRDLRQPGRRAGSPATRRPMNREQKAAAVAEIAEQIQESDAVFAIDYRGISVTQVADLRAQAARRRRELPGRQELAHRACRRRRRGRAEGAARRPDRADVRARRRRRAPRRRSRLQQGRRSCSLQGRRHGRRGDRGRADPAIAKLPSRDVLYGQLVGMVASPLTGLARGLGGLSAAWRSRSARCSRRRSPARSRQASRPAAEEAPAAEDRAETEAPAEEAAADEAQAAEAEAPEAEADADAEAPDEAPRRGGARRGGRRRGRPEEPLRQRARRTPGRAELAEATTKEEVDMATTTQDWIEELKGISVLELAERIKALEEEFGVSATAVAAAAPAAGGGGGGDAPPRRSPPPSTSSSPRPATRRSRSSRSSARRPASA